MVVIVIPVAIGALGMVQKTRKGAWTFGNWRTYGDPIDYSVLKISQNTEESWDPDETCCHSDFSERNISKAGVKKSPGVM